MTIDVHLGAALSKNDEISRAIVIYFIRGAGNIHNRIIIVTAIIDIPFNIEAAISCRRNNNML